MDTTAGTSAVIMNLVILVQWTGNGISIYPYLAGVAKFIIGAKVRCLSQEKMVQPDGSTIET